MFSPSPVPRPAIESTTVPTSVPMLSARPVSPKRTFVSKSVSSPPSPEPKVTIAASISSVCTPSASARLSTPSVTAVVTPPTASSTPVSWSLRPVMFSVSPVSRSVTESTTSPMSKPKLSAKSPKPVKTEVSRPVRSSPVAVPRFDIARIKASVERPKFSARSSIPL